jgi:hypothetical protein
MKPMHGMVQPMYIGLLLGFTLVVCCTATVVAAPPFEAAQTVLSQDDTDQKDDTARKEVIPLPAAGETAYFRYERDRGDMYRIIPTDGSPAYLVSASFLQVTLDSPQLDSFQQAEVLRSYPALMQEMFTNTMAQMYPDGTTAYETPFPTQWLTSTDGTWGLLEQDPAATPYIRVRLGGGGEEAVEFSVARSMVEQMLAHQQLADDQLLQNLRSFPYRLPEAARVGDFARLSTADLALLVQREPGLRRYEFLQMGRFSPDGAENRSAETPRQQRRPRVEQPPAAASPVASPPAVLLRPPLAQLPSQTPAARGIGAQPPSDSGAYALSPDRLFPQKAGSIQRSPVASTEAANAHDTQTNLWRLSLHIAALSLCALGILAFVISRRTR